MSDLFSVSLIIIAYFLGSASAAIITCKLMGKEDPRTLGSQNPGATNVMRYAGKKAAIITLLGDLLKGLDIGGAGRKALHEAAGGQMRLEAGTVAVGTTLRGVDVCL